MGKIFSFFLSECIFRALEKVKDDFSQKGRKIQSWSLLGQPIDSSNTFPSKAVRNNLIEIFLQVTLFPNSKRIRGER